MPILIALFLMLAMVWVFIATWIGAIVLVGAVIWYLVTLDWKEDWGVVVFYFLVLVVIVSIFRGIYHTYDGVGIFFTICALLVIIGMFSD